MVLPIAILLAAAAASSAVPAPAAIPANVPASEQDGTAALALFQRDVALNYWALKHYDSDGDIALSPREAATAASALKAIADENGDGRVTTDEFDRARECILARF